QSRRCAQHRSRADGRLAQGLAEARPIEQPPVAEWMREEVLILQLGRVPRGAHADAVELARQTLEAEPREKRSRRGVEVLAGADYDDVPAGATERDRRGASGGPGADDDDAHQVGNSLSVSTLKTRGKLRSRGPGRSVTTSSRYQFSTICSRVSGVLDRSMLRKN